MHQFELGWAFLLFVMDDYGISDTLPSTSNEKIKFMLKRLSETRVEDFHDLEYVEVDDLTRDGILKPMQARKLVNRWKRFKRGISLFIQHAYSFTDRQDNIKTLSSKLLTQGRKRENRQLMMTIQFSYLLNFKALFFIYTF